MIYRSLDSIDLSRVKTPEFAKLDFSVHLKIAEIAACSGGQAPTLWILELGRKAGRSFFLAVVSRFGGKWSP